MDLLDPGLTKHDTMLWRPWSDGQSKSNVHEQSIDLLVNNVGNAMKVDHCRCIASSDHGRMCDRECRKENERLNWEMEEID